MNDHVVLLGLMGSGKTSVGKRVARAEQAGMMVAVEVGDGMEDKALEALRSVGAADLEVAEGNIVAGDWADFDPVKPPYFVDQQTRTPDRPHAEGPGPV